MRGEGKALTGAEEVEAGVEDAGEEDPTGDGSRVDIECNNTSTGTSTGEMGNDTEAAADDDAVDDDGIIEWTDNGTEADTDNKQEDEEVATGDVGNTARATPGSGERVGVGVSCFATASVCA